MSLLEAKGLAPNKEAAASALNRRLHYDLVVSGEDLDDQSCILLLAETSEDLRVNRQLDSPPTQFLVFYPGDEVLRIRRFIFEGLV
jgi:hypothetical protein